MDGHVVDVKMAPFLYSSCLQLRVIAKKETGKTALIDHSSCCGVCLSSSYTGKGTRSGYRSEKLEEACPLF